MCVRGGSFAVQSCALGPQIHQRQRHWVSAVQPALGFLAPAPPPGTRVFAVSYRGRAWRAADARVPAVMEGVVGHGVGVNEGPHVVVAPRRERVDLHPVAGRVGFDDGSMGTLRSLFPPDGRNPRVHFCQLVLQRRDLAEIAASIGIPGPECVPECRTLLRNGQRWSHRPNAQPVAGLEPPPEIVGLVEQQPGVHSEYVDWQRLLGNQVNENAALGAEPRAERHAWCKLVRGPGEDVRCRLSFELRRPFACSTLGRHTASLPIGAARLLVQRKGPGALWSIPGLWVRRVYW